MPISNIIFTATCGHSLNLFNPIWIQLPHYTPPRYRFPGGTLKLPHVTVLVFRSGKIVINKTTVTPDVGEISAILGTRFTDLKMSHCSGYLKLGRIDLAKLRNGTEGSIWEPELHPGLSLKLDNVSVIAYHTGTVMYCGCRSREQAVYVERKIKLLINNIRHDHNY